MSTELEEEGRGMANFKEEVREEFEGCVTEIGANMTLSAKDDYNRGWNDASLSAMRFIRRYIRGDGLFQQAVPSVSEEDANG